MASLDFGKHANKTYGEIVLADPAYARWMLEKFQGQPHNQGKLNLLNGTIEAFDKLPFIWACQSTRNGVRCDNEAEYATTHDRKAELSFWCTQCNPRRHRAQGTALNQLFSYHDALRQSHHIDQRVDGEWLLRAFIRAKTGKFEPTVEGCDAFFDQVFSLGTG